MDDNKSSAAENIVHDAAILAETVVTDAAKTAKDVVSEAAHTATTMMSSDHERTTNALADALRQVFGEHTNSGRFIDMNKIPLICKAITNLDTNVVEIKNMIKLADSKYVNQDQFSPVRAIAYGLIGLLATGVAGAILSQIFL